MPWGIGGAMPKGFHPVQSPTAAAAFWLNRDPSLMYLRKTVMDLWPVVCAIPSWNLSARRRPRKQ